jgi:hypothetical protein
MYKKRCPSGGGGINIEQLYILFLVIVILILFGYIYIKHLHHDHSHYQQQPSNIVIKEQHSFHNNNVDNTLRPVPLPLMGDVLLNPYQPPLRDDRYFPGAFGMATTMPGIATVMPINVPTQSINTSYRQVGILTRGDTILPLMGKPLFTNRDKWNFYTMNDKNNMIKLPLSNKGKSCTSEFGCDNIYNGDSVYVEGYKHSFKATVYDNQVMQYIPFL